MIVLDSYSKLFLPFVFISVLGSTRNDSMIFLAFVAGSFRVTDDNYLFEADLSGQPSTY